MIEVCSTVPNPDRLAAWLDRTIRPHLRPDVSRYARGRLRAWLRVEPTLTSPTRRLPGVPVDDRVWSRLGELLGRPFDYCLVTYSGDDQAIGIGPHRDAAFADFEAFGLHASGEARFDYWMGRPAFGFAPDARAFDPARDDPTHSLVLSPGQVVRFNCKNLHAATPGPGRWGLNFWAARR